MHVPFCLAKCRYCDFYSVPAGDNAAERFVQAALVELDERKVELDAPLSSVFIGGGTPTALGPQRLGELLRSIQPFINAETEFSVEANPGVLDGSLIETLVSCGVNRVNLGVQSFQDAELKLLGRIHTAGQAMGAVEDLRRAGIANVGLDLIYGIPNQTIDSWRDSLAEALALKIEHLSCYGLSFEHGTPLDRDLIAGRVRQMPDELQEQCYNTASAATSQAGLEHYEISNFARPSRRCKHNITYWNNGNYVGIGPGAASYVGGIRSTNRPDLHAYCTSLLSQPPRQSPADREKLTGRSAMAETLMLGLRMLDGVDRQAFQERFGEDPVEAFARTISRYERLGAVIVTSRNLCIARESLFVSDTILADLIAEV